MEGLIFFFFELVGIVQGVIQFFFSGRFTGIKPKAAHYIIYLLLFEICSIIGRFSPYYMLSVLLNVLVLYGTIRFLLGNGRLISGITAIYATSIMQLSYGTVNAFSSIMVPYVERGILLPLLGLIGIISSILALALGFCCCHVIGRYFTLKKDSSNPYLVMLLVPALSFFVMGFYIINTVYGNEISIPLPAEPGKNVELLFLQLLGFCAMLSTLYAHQKLEESFRIKSQFDLLKQETHTQRTYVTEANIRYEQTRAFRHDIKNHLLVLNGLLKTGETKQANAYLEKLESITGDLSFPVWTGNPVVDILLSSKLELARQNGINTDVSLTLPQPCRVDDLDLCVIFSNALDNAITACTQLSGTKTIRIAGERQGDFFLLEFENTCWPETVIAPEIGTGLSNIKTVAEKYGGAVTIEHAFAHFSLDVLLNIS